MKQEPRSLIMCMTPLQILIAEKIIELHPDEIFDVLVIALNDNEKYRAYFERVEKLCMNSLYYTEGKGSLVFFGYIAKLKKHSLNIKYDNYYLASIDSRHFQYIISKNKHANIFTFDDGTANIISTSKYYSNSKPKIFKRTVWRMLGVKYYMEDLKQKSLLHYTIYQNIPNIIKNQQYISLIPATTQKQSKRKDRIIKFYLGQPLTDISTSFDPLFVKKNIDKLKLDYYYPHPREFSYPEGNYQLITSSLIFEDYIVQFLEEHPDVSIEVFSFTSTALLNVMSLNRLQAIYIYEKQIFNLQKSFYDFTKESLGIPCLDLDSI